MIAASRLVVFNGRKSLAFAQTAKSCFEKAAVSVDVVGMGGAATADATVKKRDMLIFPIFSDVRIPQVVFDQVCSIQPLTEVRVAVIGDFAAETDFRHMWPLAGELVRIVRERGGQVESPVLLIDYDAVTHSEIIGGWVFGCIALCAVDGVKSLEPTVAVQRCDGPPLESLSVVRDCVGAEVRYECNAEGECVGLSLLTRDEYPKSLWPRHHEAKKRLLREIERIYSLRYLAIPYAESEVTDLPPSLLNRLSSLDLRGSALGATHWLAECKRLEHLNLNACGLAHVPTSVFSCSQLRRLFLCKNRLSEFGGPWECLKDLEVLSLYRNNLEFLSQDLASLVRLRRLNCGANPLQALPAAMAGMATLEILQLDRTSIAGVPGICGLLPSLKRVSLRAMASHGANSYAADAHGQGLRCEIVLGRCHAVLLNLGSS